MSNSWEEHIGPGGKHQWRPVNGSDNTTMMLTSDISLLRDPANKYQPFVQLFAGNLSALTETFSAAWYKVWLCGVHMTFCLHVNMA